MQKEGKLSQAKCIFHTISEPEIPLAIYSEAVDHGIVTNQNLHKKVVDIVTTLQGRTLILVDRISHGDQLKAFIPTAYWITGKDDADTRRQVIDMLKNSKTSCVAIATQQIMNTGINVMLHNLINCAGGQAEHLIIQRFGRGLRLANDKEHVTYYDFYFTNNPYLKNIQKAESKHLKKKDILLNLLISF